MSLSRVLGLKERRRCKGEEGEGLNRLRMCVSPESNTPTATLGLHTGSDRLPHTCFSTAAGSYYRLLLGIWSSTLTGKTAAKALHGRGGRARHVEAWARVTRRKDVRPDTLGGSRCSLQRGLMGQV